MNLYGYSEVRKLHSDNLRALCIKESWYTSGGSEEYADLLSRVEKIENVTTDNIVEIATDIYSHSDFSNIETEKYTMGEILLDIMFKIGNSCTTLFYEG